MDVIVMCGLPATGKTTTAGRLHAAFGGRLIRSCDVFRDLGISLPAWVRRTKGFTEGVDEYVTLRDAAYREMARRLDAALAAGTDRIVVDAVHGEADKRAAVYALCGRYRASPVLVWCRCDDPIEIDRRVRARQGRECEPENEAADPSVVWHLLDLWQRPLCDLPATIPMVVYDTVTSRVVDRIGPAASVVDAIVETLSPPLLR